jgi:Mn-dependent DtxR family transcriptional regulator
MTNNNIFIKADEIATELGVSKPYAYKLVKRMNEELRQKGFVTIPGRVSRQYYREKVYGSQTKERVSQEEQEVM